MTPQEIREKLDRRVLAVWADCAGIADTLYEDESLFGNGTVTQAIYAANHLSQSTDDMKELLDQYAEAIKREAVKSWWKENRPYDVDDRGFDCSPVEAHSGLIKDPILSAATAHNGVLSEIDQLVEKEL